MVEQMINSKFSKQGVGGSGSVLASFDKKPVGTPKNITLRDVQNDNRNAIPRPSSNFASHRETESAVASTRAMPVQSRPRLQSAGSPIANRQFVYARRKSDAELTNGQSSKKNSRVNPQPQADIKEPNRRNTSEFATIPVNSTANPREILNSETGTPNRSNISEIATIPKNSTVNQREILNSGTGAHRKHDNGQPTVAKFASLDDTRVRGKQHWRDRFIQLQTYLKHCNSNQEAYVKKLRSLTSDESSRLAVELERRAIQLMLEEGREIQRMRDLNILGKQSANLSPSTTLFKSEK